MKQSPNSQLLKVYGRRPAPCSVVGAGRGGLMPPCSVVRENGGRSRYRARLSGKTEGDRVTVLGCQPSTVPIGTATPSPLGGRGREIGGNTKQNVSLTHSVWVAACCGGG